MFVLYEHSQIRALEKYKYYARIMGAEIKDEPTASRAESLSADEPTIQSGALFKSPKAYQHLTKQQRDKLTQDMMAQHKRLSKRLPGMGGG